MYNKDLVEDAKDFARDQLSVYRYYDMTDRDTQQSFVKALRLVMRTFRDWGLEVVLDNNNLVRFEGVDFVGSHPRFHYSRRD